MGGRRACGVVPLLVCALLLGACQTGAQANPAIDVDHAVALWDQPLHIRVTGVPAGTAVDVAAEARDDAGVRWTASARFQSTAPGLVDLARQAPSSGSYRGVDGMGLFWSLLPNHAVASQTFFAVRTGETVAVTLTADAGGRRAVRRVERQTVDPAVQRTPVRDAGLVGTLFTPPGAGRHPAVVTLGGSEGGLREGEAALLASHGLTALALAYFDVPGTGLPGKLANIPLEYFARAADWLRAQPAADPAHVGVIGASRGGELALLLGATYPTRFQAVVGYVPSAFVYAGLSGGAGTVAAWTLAGQPFAFAPIDVAASTVDARGYHERPGFERPLADPSATAPAAIPVERIAGPLLLISGTDDQLWPSDRYAALVVARRRDHGVTSDVNLVYRGAGHFIGAPYGPTNASVYVSEGFPLYVGGSPRAYASADEDSWPKLLAFLKTSLG